MSDGPKHSNRIPFEELDAVSSWSIPSLDGGGRVVPSAQREAQDKPRGKGERVEDVDPADLAPMTAEQLEMIAEQAEKEGREKGYKEGYEKGYSEGEGKGLKHGETKAYKEKKQELEEQIERFKHMAESLMEPLQMQEAAIENILLEMVMQISRHLINKELSEDPSSVFQLIDKAVASLPAGSSHLKIYLNPDDLEPAHEAFSAQQNEWRFIADPKLQRGGCRVESTESLVDYSVENRLAALFDEANLEKELSAEEMEAPED